jgi:hypothetical protein
MKLQMKHWNNTWLCMRMLTVGRGALVLEFVELTPLDLGLQESLCMNLCVI